MIDTVSASTKTFPTPLAECDGVIGVLESVAQEAGAVVAQVDGQSYEVPEAMQAELSALVGQRAIIACIAGQVRAGRCT